MINKDWCRNYNCAAAAPPPSPGANREMESGRFIASPNEVTQRPSSLPRPFLISPHPIIHFPGFRLDASHELWLIKTRMVGCPPTLSHSLALSLSRPSVASREGDALNSGLENTPLSYILRGHALQVPCHRKFTK